jgi:hypothetical protein
MMKEMFYVDGFDGTLTGNELLMTLCEWVMPWRVPFHASSDTSGIEGTEYHSLEEALRGV